MTKDKVLNVAGNVGKAAIRGFAYFGTNVALVGGGLIGSLLLAGRFKNVAIQTAIYSIGLASSGVAAYLIGDMVDKHLVEEYDLDF